MPIPIATKAAGMALGVPDVCKTPFPPPTGTVPVPYPNTGQLPSAMPVSLRVLVDSKEVVVESSRIPASEGDQAGAQGGVTSGITSGEVSFKQSAARVYVDGQKPVFLTAMSAHNGTNPNVPVGLVAVPSQVKVFVEPF